MRLFFLNLSLLLTFVIGSTNIAYSKILKGTCGDNVTYNLVVPYNLIDKYKSADIWRKTKLSATNQLSWNCGIGVNCSLDIDSGELIVNGTGAISDYAKLDAAPWNEYREYIKRIYINDGITRIGQCAFVDLPNVEYVSLPSTLEEIGVMGLCGMGEMQELILPESLTVLENGALGVNQDLKNIILPSNLKTLGDAAFYECKSLSEITIPENVTTIGINLFRNSGVDKVTLNNQTIAGKYYDRSENLLDIFGNPNIENIEFGDKVTSIGANALFSENRNNRLSSVTFGKNVKSIGIAAFYECSRLTHITCDAHIPPSLGTDVFHSVDLSKVSLAVPFLSTEKYKSADVWKEFKLSTSTQVSWSCGINANCSLDIDSGELIVNGTGAIYDFADNRPAPWYEYREYIKRIYINDGITRIGKYAFSVLSNVEYVSLPSTLEEIGVMGLCYLGEIQELILPESLTVLDNGALAFNAVRNIILPSNLKTIGDAAFSYCKSLSEITIPENVTTLGINLFLNSGVNKVTLNSQTIAGKYYDRSENLLDIFGNPNIENIEFGDKVTSIGANALFSENRNNRLSSVTFGGDVRSIGEYAFYCCDKLENLDFKSKTSLETIEAFAFSECKSLKEFTIGKNIKTIGSCAFENCISLKTVLFEKGTKLKEIPSRAFYNCSLKDLIIPEGVESIGEKAFCEGSSYMGTILFPHSLQSLSNDWYGLNHQIIECDDLIVLCDWYKVIDGWRERWPVHFRVKDLSTWSDNKIYFTYDNDMERWHAIDSLDYVVTPTSLKVKGIYCTSDRVGIKSMELLNEIDLHHLPQLLYKDVPFRVTLDDGTVFNHYLSVSFPVLWLKTCEPTITSASKAILRAETSIKEQENNVGFEIRKYDAPSEMASKKIPGYLFNGMIEGIIDNISPTYYKVRAFYQPEYGEIVYGEWVTFDATDFSQSDPVVHTYDEAYVSNNNSVTLRGIVIEGTDVVLETGFEYWTIGTAKKVVKASRTNNTIFSTTISNIDSNKEYEYRAYAVTDKGITYGETESFFIDVADAIELVTVDDISVGDVYDVSGVKTNHKTPGINIVCMKNGVIKKLLVR